MNILEKDKYQLKEYSYFVCDKSKQNDFSFLRMFLLYSFGYIKRMGVTKFVTELETLYKNGLLFELVYVHIDNKNKLVYLSESYDDYCNRPTTPEIDELLEEEDFIQLCKMGFLSHTIMTKENFIHLLLVWDKILDQLPPFALLYLDDQNWYDILPFDSQEAMEKFVADHTKIESQNL